MKNSIKTIQGKDRQETFEKAKAEYGDDFSLVQVREIKKGLVETTILIDEEDEPKPKKVANNPYEKQVEKNTNNNVSKKTEVASLKSQTQNLSKEIQEILDSEGYGDKLTQDNKKSKINMDGLDPKIANMNINIDGADTQKSKNTNDNEKQITNDTGQKTLQEIESIKTDIARLMGTLKSLQSMFLEEKGYSTKDFVIPPEFSDVFRVLKASGISKRHLHEIFKNCIQNMPIKMKDNPITVERYFKTLLNNMILTRRETSTISKRKIIMLVGPTGVGKTTSIAKIAARYCFSGSAKKNVGIITLDDYRLGAVDQIMTYAKIMKLSIQAVVNPTEFVSAINELSGCDYILIDTAGSSPYNKAQIASIKRFLEEDDMLDISVNLVLATNMLGDVMEDTFKNFSTLDIDTIILTKLDETKKMGHLFSFLFDYKKPISYLSIGQEVPDDFKEADKSFLVEQLFKY